MPAPTAEAAADHIRGVKSGPSGWYTTSHARGASVGLGLLVLLRGPEREVVAEQLHDEGGVLVALLVERVELGDGVVEGLAGQGQG